MNRFGKSQYLLVALITLLLSACTLTEAVETVGEASDKTITASATAICAVATNQSLQRRYTTKEQLLAWKAFCDASGIQVRPSMIVLIQGME